MTSISDFNDIDRTKTEALKTPPKSYNLPPLFKEPVTIWNWYKFVGFQYLSYVIPLTCIAIYGALTTKLTKPTLIFSVLCYVVTKISLIGGYHRYWSHRSYGATIPLRYFYAIVGAGALQKTILWWCYRHRAHHRYIDTDKDPYNAARGFWYSHIGWALTRRPDSCIGYADTSDIEADPVAMFQEKYYYPMALTVAFVIPTLIAGLGWGDYRGGFVYACVFRNIAVRHATFAVNSFAHLSGDTTYDDHHTPRDNWIVGIMTMGEGYHNFHHQFPQDYRNAIRYYQFDPTKWFIYTMYLCGLAYDLKACPADEISQGTIHMKEKKIRAEKAKLNYGTPLKNLPAYTWDEFQELVAEEKKKWILIEGVLYDVEEFMNEHPGGVGYVSSAVGKDMTTAFNGGFYNHSNHARHILLRLRVGVLLNGMEVVTDESN